MNTNTERHAAYKDSGVAWLGEVPAHWEVRRVKEIAFINQKTLSDGTPLDYEFDYIDIGGVTYGVSGYIAERITFENAPSRAKRIVKSGDTIISTVRTYLKAITQIEYAENLIVSTGFAVLTPKKIIHKSYFSNWLMSETFINRVSAISKGVSYPATNATEIGDLFVALPPLPEQAAIAAYLDTQTARIDRQIDLLRQKSEQYAQLKQSLINETVTRGLNPAVAMKDSGVAWIGEVPAHWEVRRVKEIASINQKTLSDGTPLDYEFDYVDIGGVTYGVSGYIAERITFENAPSRAKRIVKSGDTIISTVRTYLKAITQIEYAENLIVSTGFAVLTPKKIIHKSYFSNWLMSETFINRVSAISKGVSYPATNATEIGDLFVALPPLPEQAAIAAYLDTQTARIDRIAANLFQQIEQLQTLRQALINEAVTGQIKINPKRLAA